MGYYNFQKDLKVSYKSVDKVKNLLESKGAEQLEINHDKKYDIRFTFNSRCFTIEVKQDFLFQKTGNVAIEYVSRNRDSGVTTSEADIWCYVLGEEVYFCPTKRLRAILENTEFRKVSGGDNNTSRMYLVPVKTFKEIFKLDE
jgi:hypothetical protein